MINTVISFIPTPSLRNVLNCSEQEPFKNDPKFRYLLCHCLFFSCRCHYPHLSPVPVRGLMKYFSNPTPNLHIALLESYSYNWYFQITSHILPRYCVQGKLRNYVPYQSKPIRRCNYTIFLRKLSFHTKIVLTEIWPWNVLARHYLWIRFQWIKTLPERAILSVLKWKPEITPYPFSQIK